MYYYKNLLDNCICSLEERENKAHGIEITKEQYNTIVLKFKNKPVAPNGYYYVLTNDLEWKMYEYIDEEEKLGNE